MLSSVFVLNKFGCSLSCVGPVGMVGYYNRFTAGYDTDAFPVAYLEMSSNLPTHWTVDTEVAQRNFTRQMAKV